MIRAFWFVTSRSFKNRIVRQLRKLRSPRYLASMLAAIAYFWFFVFRRAHAARGISRLPSIGFAADILSIMVLAAMLVAWALPEDSGGLAFTEAEVQFLFPAPLRRRDLLSYKLWRQQSSLLISAIMMTLLAFRSGKFVGVWIALVAMSVYFTAVALARARLRRFGIGFGIRLPATILIAAGVAALIVHDVRTGPPMHLASKHAVAGASRVTLIHEPAVRAILAMPRVVAGAAFPASNVELLRTCLLLLLAIWILYEIAARIDVSFEESSVEASSRRAQARATATGTRFGNRVVFRAARLPFRLSGKPAPEVAIAWKNLTAAMRTSTPAIVMVLGFAGAIAAWAALRRGDAAGPTALGLVLATIFPLMSAQVLRHDLRLDLPRIELLKTYPIAGDRLVLAEIAAPTVIVAAVEMILLTMTFAVAHAFGAPSKFAFVGTPEFIVIALLITTPIAAVQLAIQNAAAILLPGWTVQSPEESRGFAAMGQRLVLLAGNLLVLATVLVPAAVVSVPLYLFARRFGSHPFVLAMTTAPAVAVIVFEVWIAIRFLGAQFERIDAANEMDVAV